jgi:hypothetical protein
MDQICLNFLTIEKPYAMSPVATKKDSPANKLEIYPGLDGLENSNMP